MSPAKSPKWRAMLAMAFGIVGFAWGANAWAKPTAAFLDATGQPVGNLLEQSLLASKKVVWVERTEIDKVLRERKITELLGPAACSERAVLGRLLKADVLVLMAPGSGPEKQVQLVVCETGQGLRLAAQTVPAGGDAAATVKRLTALVDDALARQGQPIREIVAVPYFVSNNLTYEHDYLKAALPKVVEEIVRNQPGCLTVEFEEAQALERELKLSGGEVRRATPLYFLGEFRHARSDARSPVSIRLRILRGEKVLLQREGRGLSAAGALDFLRQAARDMLGKGRGTAPLAGDPSEEVRQIAARAETFYRLGDWAEAAALAEAALLLDGKQTRMHEIAAGSLAAIASAAINGSRQTDRVIDGLHRYVRAMEHYETVLKETGTTDWSATCSPSCLWSRMWGAVNWHNIRNPGSYAPEVREAAVPCREQVTEIIVRIIRDRCQRRTGDALVVLDSAIMYRPECEVHPLVGKAVEQIQDLPDAKELICSFWLQQAVIRTLDNPDGRRCVQGMMASDNPTIRQVAKELKRQLDTGSWKDKTRVVEVKSDPDPKGQRVAFTPIDGTTDKFITPAGPGVDLTWLQFHTAGIMKSPGQPEWLWNSGGYAATDTRITGCQFDGRFGWVTGQGPGGKVRLAILDPQGEKAWEIGQAEGLPLVDPATIPNNNTNPQIWVEPLEPGRALMAYWFGRLMIAVVRFDANHRLTVDRLLEARDHGDPEDAAVLNSVHLAFCPKYVLAFAGTTPDGKPLRRVLIGGRRFHDDHPLLVDPDSCRVSVLDHSFDFSLCTTSSVTREAIYRIEIIKAKLHLCRIGLPDFRVESLLTPVPLGECVKYGDKFLIIGGRWWVIDLKEEPENRIREIADRQPWCYGTGPGPGSEFVDGDTRPHFEKYDYEYNRVVVSNVYGLVVERCRYQHSSERTAYQITIDGKPVLGNNIDFRLFRQW